MFSRTEEAPPSPTLSAASFTSSSWQHKSINEIIPILKTTYNTIKDKDKDLKIAAHFGQSLLENNIALKSSYDQLLQNAPYPTPTQSTSLINLSDDEEDEEDLKFIEPARSREAIVEILEQQNAELQDQLEKILSNQKDLDRSHQSRSKRLNDEVEYLQGCLERATNTIQKIEENRKSKKTLTKDSLLITVTNVSTSTCCSTINEKINQLRTDYDHLSQSKIQIEIKLEESLNKVNELRQQYETTTQDHENLQRAFEQQNDHIDELKATIEDHRSTLSRLRDQDSCSSIYTSSGTSSDASSVLTNDYELANRTNTSLLTELKLASNEKPLGDTTFHTYKSNVDSTVESILDKVDQVDNNNLDLLDDALSLVGKLATEYDHTKFIQQKRYLRYSNSYQDDEIQEESIPLQYPSLDQYKVVLPVEKPSPSIQEICVSFIRSILGLVRFCLVLVIAVFFSFKKGPSTLY